VSEMLTDMWRRPRISHRVPVTVTRFPSNNVALLTHALSVPGGAAICVSTRWP